MPSLAARVLLEILVETGQTVDVGTPPAIFDAEDPDVGGGGMSFDGAEEVARNLPSSYDSEDVKRTLSPVVRRLTDNSGVDLSAVVDRDSGGPFGVT